MDAHWDVFLAHSSNDSAMAEALADALEPHVAVFLASRCIQPSYDWDTTIRDAIVAAPIFIVLVSSSTDEAFFQRDEILRAIDLARQTPPRTNIVPVYIRGTRPESDRIPYGLRPKQGIILSDDSDLPYVAEQILSLLMDIGNSYPEDQSFSASIRLHLAKIEQDVEQLTQEQFRAIQMLRYIPRVRISGSAGSGKTLVAAEKASRLADAGLKVLFLCHNPLLADYVRQLTAGAGVHVRDFERWIGEMTFSDSFTSTEWSYFNEPSDILLDRACDILSQGQEKYDAVIVDEGQDFREKWWVVIEKAMCPEDSLFYIFHDNNQSLLPYRSAYPIAEPHIDLSRNCRNAGRVFELMRCFNSDCPRVERRLREKGKVSFKAIHSGQEATEVASVLSELYRADLIKGTVVLWMGSGSLPDSPLAGLQCRLSDCGEWQVEVRRQFELILNKYNQRGVTVPANADNRVAEALSRLSQNSFPSVSDVEVVMNLARLFSVEHHVRSRIESSRLYRLAFQWRKAGPLLKLRRRTSSGAIWAAEVLLHFSRETWHEGIPKGELYHVRPYFELRTANTVPLYGVPDFKGLETDTVVLVLRGKVLNSTESLYVGISRARLLLIVLADQLAAEMLPRSFVWD